MKLARSLVRISFVVVALFGTGQFAHAQSTSYTLYRIGLTDAEFTGSQGGQWSDLLGFENGIVAGTSRRGTDADSGGLFPLYMQVSTGDAAPAIGGNGAWLANAATGHTMRIGFWGPDFTDASGNQLTNLVDFHGGYAVGVSNAYNPSGTLGSIAWVASGTTGVTWRIGLTGAAFTNADGSQYSYARAVQDGYVLGMSFKAGNTGTATWVADATTGTTTRIGLYGPGYISDTGVEDSGSFGRIPHIDSGFVAGGAEMYSGGTDMGSAAWVANVATGMTTRIQFTGVGFTLADSAATSSVSALKGGYVGGVAVTPSSTNQVGWVAPTSTGRAVRVGLTGAAFGDSDGHHLDTVDWISNGYAAGTTSLISGSSGNGHATWVANASTGATIRIGYYDAFYTRTDGGQESAIDGFHDGYVAGHSVQYPGGMNGEGSAVWVAQATTATTQRIGLFGTAYTAPDGAQYSYITNFSGKYVAGTSNIVEGGGGQFAWVANAETGLTTPLGMTDAAHTYSGGGVVSNIVTVTSTGFVAGYSQLPNGGQTAWIFDANTSVFDPIEFSIRPSDGYAVSRIFSLLDNGVAVGEYELFDASGTDLGLRAFAWTLQDGAFDLSSIPSNLSAAGLAALSEAELGDPVLGAIAGYGTVTGSPNSQGAFLLMPTPEPGSAALLALGATLLVRRRHRVA